MRLLLIEDHPPLAEALGDKLARARAHLDAGLTVREAAARVKVGKTALYKALGGSTMKPVE